MKPRKLRDYDKVLEKEYEAGRIVKFSALLCLVLIVIFTGALIIDLTL